MWGSLLEFVGALALVTLASLVLARAIDRVGARLGFTEGLLGIVTALGADAPEISSSIAALARGHHELGVGVVLGSNVFNMAALLGLSAVVAGRMKVSRATLLVNGAIAAVSTTMLILLVLKVVGPLPAVLTIAGALVPYVLVESLPRRALARLRLPESILRVGERTRRDADKGERAPKAEPQGWRDALAGVPALVTIIVASDWLVASTVDLGRDWHVPHAILGMLVIASLTGIPNVLAAIRLARRGRGSAVLSESLNSNTLNALAGACVPALVVGLGALSLTTELASFWLAGITACALAFAVARRGLGRLGGGVVLGIYAAFVVVVLAVAL